MKKCPFCAEEIQDAAIVCKHCGRELVVGPAFRASSRTSRRRIGLVMAGAAGLMLAILAYGGADPSYLARLTPTANNPNAAQARSLCQQLMGPVGASVFYDPLTPQPQGNTAQYWVNTVGNPSVDPEEATTWTAGFVWQPNTGRALRDGFSATVDWYDIDIQDMIAVEAAANVYEACLSIVTNPTGDVAQNTTGGGQ